MSPFAWQSDNAILFYLFFFFFFINLFIYFWLHWVFVAARGLSLVAASGGYSSLPWAGFSLWWLLLRSTSSRHAGFGSCGLRTLELRLSSCGARAYLVRGIGDLPRPGLKPVSPALADRFLTTAPPGKSSYPFLLHPKLCLRDLLWHPCTERPSFW